MAFGFWLKMLVNVCESLGSEYLIGRLVTLARAISRVHLGHHPHPLPYVHVVPLIWQNDEKIILKISYLLPQKGGGLVPPKHGR